MASTLIIDLIRPQYSPNSEVLVSSLVHGLFEAEGEWKKGFRFLNRDPDSAKAVTGPVSNDQRAEMAVELHRLGVHTGDSDSAELVDAIIHAVTGVSSSKGTSLPASPMTEHLALLQDLKGVLGANNPPNLAKALEGMFWMGSATQHGADTSMAGLWLQASRQRRQTEPLLSAIDQAFAASHPAGGFSQRERIEQPIEDRWIGLFPDSPFGWLHDTWATLMDPGWIEKLPTRVWTDWVTAVLRTGLAFGYLAEMRWYELLGQALLADEEVTALPTLRGEHLVPWPPSRLPVQSRNVKSEIKQAVNRGTGVLGVLRTYGDDALGSPLTELNTLRKDPDVRQHVRSALGGTKPPSFAKNTYETVIYALQQRGSGASADYYGLLKSHGTRYSVVDPGTEWVAVVASLACDVETGEANVGTVLRSLGRLGIVPELQELVRALEAAGMAQGSADADHGVRVRSAF